MKNLFPKLDDNRGFTLIEIMVVMMIVGIISTLAVNGYSQYRRTALLELAADSMVAQISEQRSKVTKGKFGGDRKDELIKELESGEEVLEEPAVSDTKCFGIYFQYDSETKTFVPYKFSQPFNGKQVWNTVTQEWEYQGCPEFRPDFDSELDLQLWEMDDSLSVTMIYRDLERIEETALEGDLVMRFLPPDGNMEIRGPFDVNFFEPNNTTAPYIFVFKYGVSDEKQYQRKLIYDTKAQSLVIEKFD